MDPRVQRVLDQESPGEELSPEQARELAVAEALIAGVLRSVPHAPLPDLAPAVMQRIQERGPAFAESSANIMSALVGWLWRPRSLSLQWRPAYAFGLAAMVMFTAV